MPNNYEEKCSCVICLDDIDDSKDKFISKCCHTYHFDCFLEYIKYNLTKIKNRNNIECPMCRTENEFKYIMYDLIEKFYNNKDKVRKLEKKKTKLQSNLMLMNLKNCLFFRRRKNIENEELIMEEIEMYNYKIIKQMSESENIRKIYYTLINRFEKEMDEIKQYQQDFSF